MIEGITYLGMGGVVRGHPLLAPVGRVPHVEAALVVLLRVWQGRWETSRGRQVSGLIREALVEGKRTDKAALERTVMMCSMGFPSASTGMAGSAAAVAAAVVALVMMSDSECGGWVGVPS